MLREQLAELDKANEAANNLANDNLNLSGMNYHHIKEIEELANKLNTQEELTKEREESIERWSQEVIKLRAVNQQLVEALVQARKHVDEIEEPNLLPIIDQALAAAKGEGK